MRLAMVLLCALSVTVCAASNPMSDDRLGRGVAAVQEGPCVTSVARLATDRGGARRDENDLDPGQVNGLLADLRHTLLRRFGTDDENRIDASLLWSVSGGAGGRPPTDGWSVPGDVDGRSVPGGAGDRTRRRLVVPVRFHAVVSGRRGRVPTSTVRRQMSTLNAAYRGARGGADTGVSFRLAGYDVTDNHDWFQQPRRYEGRIKERLRKGGPRTLNLFTAAVGEDVLGFSTFPQWYRGVHRMV